MSGGKPALKAAPGTSAAPKTAPGKAPGKLGRAALPMRSPRQTQYLKALKDNRLRNLTGHLLDIHDPLDVKDPTKEREEEEFLKLDAFSQRKRLIANKLEEIREDLKKKQELQRDDPRSRQKVEITQKIHRDYKEVQDWLADCDNIIKRDETKLRKKGNPEAERELSLKKQAYDIMKRHVDEVGELKKPTRTGAGGGGAAAVGTSFGTVDSLSDPTKTTLPEIDLSEFNQKVSKNDERINTGLNELSNRVKDLHGQALVLGQQVDEQNSKLDKLEQQTDKINEQLYTINKKLKETLAKVRGPSRFCLDVCCCCIILALAGFIYNMVKG